MAKAWSISERLVFMELLNRLSEMHLSTQQWLDLLIESQTKKEARRLCDELRLRVSQGQSVGEAFKVFERALGSTVIRVLRTVDEGQSLQAATQALMVWLERQNRWRMLLFKVLTYPLMLLGLLSILLGVLMVFLVPQFEQALPKETLGWSSISLLAFAHGIQSMGLEALLIVVLLGLGLLSKKGRVFWSRWISRVPVVRRLWYAMELYRWSESMRLLNASNVSLKRALKLSANELRHPTLHTLFSALPHQLEQGLSLKDSLQQHKELPPMLLGLLRVQQGQSDLLKVWGYLSKEFERQMEHAVFWVEKVFEPVCLLLVAGLLIWIVVGLFLPMYEMAWV